MVKDPRHEYRFTMENKNMQGSWSGIFESCDGGTEIIFTEQAAYIADLREALDGKLY